MTIYRENGKLLMDRKFKDGSSMTIDLIEKQSPLGRRFEEAAGSRSGDHFLLAANGNLEIKDTSGVIAIATPVRIAEGKELPVRAPEVVSVPTTAATGGRQFLKSKLAELDSFRADPKFHQFGFGVGGPFNSWLKSVESKREDSSFVLRERVAVGDLQMLGLEYMKTKGRENEYTRYTREQIAEVLRDDAR